jgi:hypothetical protein
VVVAAVVVVDGAAVVVVAAAVVVVVAAVVVVVATVVVVVAGGSVVVSGGLEVDEAAMVDSVLLEQPPNRTSTRSTAAGLTHPLYGANSGTQ